MTSAVENTTPIRAHTVPSARRLFTALLVVCAVVAGLVHANRVMVQNGYGQPAAEQCGVIREI